MCPETYYTRFEINGIELFRVHIILPLMLNSRFTYQGKYYGVKKLIFEFEEEWLTNRHWLIVEIYETTQIPEGF
jgi:hypothetical protein